MADFAAEHSPKRRPTHPGELLRDVIPATGKSKAEIAALLGISRQHFYDILKERKPVSPSVAVRLGSCSATAQGFGCACRGRTIPGTPSANWPPRSRKYRG